MSHFKLGGVPYHAHDLFHKLRDRVNRGDGANWSEALKTFLECENPQKIRKALEALKE